MLLPPSFQSGKMSPFILAFNFFFFFFFRENTQMCKIVSSEFLFFMRYKREVMTF